MIIHVCGGGNTKVCMDMYALRDLREVHLEAYLLAILNPLFALHS